MQLKVKDETYWQNSTQDLHDIDATSKSNKNGQGQTMSDMKFLSKLYHAAVSRFNIWLCDLSNSSKEDNQLSYLIEFKMPKSFKLYKFKFFYILDKGIKECLKKYIVKAEIKLQLPLQ